MLAKIEETPESFFKEYIYTYAHDKSIKAVAQGMVAGAAVDSLIWEYMNQKVPGIQRIPKLLKSQTPMVFHPWQSVSA